MRIALFQQNTTRIGGSIATMLAFADYFKSQGHSVRVFSSWGGSYKERCIKHKKSLLEFYGFSNLILNDFDWDCPLSKQGHVKLSPKDFDLIFTRGFFPGTYRKQKVPAIVWTIVPQEAYLDGNILKRWTNSVTIQRQLWKQCRTAVVIPPHDYTMFREAARLHRDIDLVAVLRANEAATKGIQQFIDVAKRTGARAVLVTTVNSEETLKYVEGLPIETRVNISRRELAEVLGRSRILLHPSTVDSCPLVLYEAMNAGCIPITRDVGAAREQVGLVGHVFSTDREMGVTSTQALSDSRFSATTEQIMARGALYDRQSIGALANARLLEATNG